jgi:antibiotic biosynthesis monooxygenase (ABM) superfamily enzyme
MASPTTTGASPPRYKVALLTWIGIYPVIAVLLAVCGAKIGRYPVAVRALVLTACAIPIMTWLVMPVLTRVAAGWLYRASPASNGCAPHDNAQEDEGHDDARHA